MCLAVIVLIPYASYTHGKNLALNNKNEFNSCKLEFMKKDDECIYLIKEKEVILSGMLIAKSATHIAVWDGKTTIIKPLRNNTLEIRSGELEPKSGKG